MTTYPATIDSGHGERLTFLGHTFKDGVDYLDMENCVSPGSGPPMHVHFKQTESVTVTEGLMGVEIPGEELHYFKEGETAFFKCGVIHRFWNAGNTTLKCKGQVWPANNLEYFLTQVYRSIKANKHGRPGTFDAAWLLARYKTEFDMVGIPPLVRKLIFPVAIFTGRLRGLDRKYKGAPSPVE
jgi:quercetin dioxygenase-like cupin family protein